MGAKLAGGGGKRGADVNSEPNVIPFIDVMLVLLIIFMVAAPIATVDLQVDMPDAKINPSKRPPKPVWVSVKDTNGDGEPEAYVMNEKQAFAWSDLRAAGPIVKEVERVVRENNPRLTEMSEVRDERIYIRGEGTMEYKHVVRVFNELQMGGFTKIALVADDREAFSGR